MQHTAGHPCSWCKMSRWPLAQQSPNSLPRASQLQARAPGERARLPDYCAGAMFVQQLLSRGYGFHERAFGGVTFQKKVGAGAPGRGGAGLPGCAEAEAVPLARRPGTPRSAGRSATC